MKIDEPLDRLTDRHKALTQSLELLAPDLKALKSFSKDIANRTPRLLHIALHEHRPIRLERGTD